MNASENTFRNDDRLLSEMFDMTPEKRVALLRALHKATDKVDFLNASLDALSGTHIQEKRAEIAASLADCTVRHGRDIVKGETGHFDVWHFVLGSGLDVLTLRGLVLGVQRAAGLYPEDVEAMIRRHLGPERAR